MADLTLPVDAELLPGEPIKAEHPQKFKQAIIDVNAQVEAFGLGISVFAAGFTGDGSDSVGPAVTGSLNCTSAGKEYTEWELPAGQTITFSTSTGIHMVGVQGTFELGGSLVATGTGQSSRAGTAGGGGGGADGVDGSVAQYGFHRTGLGGSTGGGGGGGGRANVTYRGGNASAGGACLGLDGGAAGAGAPLAGSAVAGTAGTAATTSQSPRWYGIPDNLSASPSGGGGGGGAGIGGTAGGNGGNGGAGGGLVYIECNEFIFLSGATIVTNGSAGAAGANSSGNAGAGGGGGGGGGGTVVIICRILTTNLGTITANGGAAGNAGTGGTGTAAAGAAGGAGRSTIVVIAS